MKKLMILNVYISVNIILLCVVDTVSGHGRLIDPPSRSSMFRYGFSNPPNYNDHQLYCGGVQVQYEQNGGKCGVCGDPWQGPRENEVGGKYANGIIVRSYHTGQVINVTVELTVNHKGYFEFRLCPNDDPKKNVTHECLNQYVLEFVDTGNTRLYIPDTTGYQNLTMRIRLPGGLRCQDCLFQWKYNAGNSWGIDPVTGNGCIGCGNQEQFYGCSDIAIGHPEIEPGMSLLTGEMATSRPIQPVPTPSYPEATEYPKATEYPRATEYTKWTQNTVRSTTTVEQEDNKDVLIYQTFQQFRDKFKDNKILPCVCQKCLGNTCICECFTMPSSTGIIISSFRKMYLGAMSVIVFIFSSRRF